MMKRWYWAAGVAGLVALSGCDDGDENVDEGTAQQAMVEPGGDEAAADQGELDPVLGAWSAEAYYEALQGTWKLGSERSQWTIEGRSLTSADGRMDGAEIKVPSPGLLSVTTEESTTHMGLAMIDGELYVGLGMGGSVVDDRILFHLGPGLVVAQDGECTYYHYVHPRRTEEGVRPTGTGVPCDFHEVEGDTYFSVTAGGQTVRPNHRVLVGDTGLADSSLRGRKIERVDP